MALYRCLSGASTSKINSKSDTGAFITINGRAYNKVNSGLAYIRMILMRNINDNSLMATVALISEDSNAIVYNIAGQSNWSVEHHVTYKNKTWYICGGQYGVGNMPDTIEATPKESPWYCYYNPNRDDDLYYGCLMDTLKQLEYEGII